MKHSSWSDQEGQWQNTQCTISNTCKKITSATRSLATDFQNTRYHWMNRDRHTGATKFFQANYNDPRTSTIEKTATEWQIHQLVKVIQISGQREINMVQMCKTLSLPKRESTYMAWISICWLSKPSSDK